MENELRKWVRNVTTFQLIAGNYQIEVEVRKSCDEDKGICEIKKRGKFIELILGVWGI